MKQMKDELEVLGGNANGCIERTEVQAKLLDARAKNSNSVTILASSSSAGRRAVGAMIREAISIGVPVYNDGDPYRCAEIYRECCEDILELQGGLVGDARETVENTLGGLPLLASDDMRAWKLRHTLDAILADGLVGRSVASSAASSVSTSEAGAKVSSRVAQFKSSGVAAGSPPISAAKELLRAESSASSSSNATYFTYMHTHMHAYKRTHIRECIHHKYTHRVFYVYHINLPHPHTHTPLHIHTHTHQCAHTCTQTHTHTQAYTHKHTHTHVHANTHNTHAHVYIYTGVYICVSPCFCTSDATIMCADYRAVVTLCFSIGKMTW